jgi:hypothetical protein
LDNQLNKYVEELKTDAKQVSKLVSDTVRLTNFGLAALLVVVRSGKIGSVDIAAAELNYILIASLLGTLGIIFDVSQNLASLEHIKRKLRLVQKLEKEGKNIVSRDQFMTLESDNLPKVRSVLFYLKIACAVFGSIFLALSILGYPKK